MSEETKTPTARVPVEAVVSKAFCKVCGGFVVYNKGCRLLSSPPKYQGKCKECGKVHYARCTDVDQSC